MTTYRDALAEIETLRQELATSEAACASAMAEVEALKADLVAVAKQADNLREQAVYNGNQIHRLQREMAEARDERDAALSEVEALRGARLLSVLFGHHEGAPKPFALQRRGGRRELVALGARFPDEAVALRLANDGGWTTASTGGVEQFCDADTEIVWLSDELEPLAAMESERDRLRTAARHVVDLYRLGNVMGTHAAVDRLGEVLEGGT